MIRIALIPLCERKILTKTGLIDHTSYKTRCGNPSFEQTDKTLIKTQSTSFSKLFHRLTFSNIQLQSHTR